MPISLARRHFLACEFNWRKWGNVYILATALQQTTNEGVKMAEKELRERHGDQMGHPSERELLIKIVKSQMMLNSKMFEFMRAYQREQNLGESSMLRNGFGSPTHIGRLLGEVNQIGFALNELVEAFIGERISEKRDSENRVMAFCNHCKKESPFVRVVDSPYGLAGAYEDGTERLICAVCKKDAIYPGDERLPKFNSVFKTK